MSAALTLDAIAESLKQVSLLHRVSLVYIFYYHLDIQNYAFKRFFSLNVDYKICFYLAFLPTCYIFSPISVYSELITPSLLGKNRVLFYYDSVPHLSLFLFSIQCSSRFPHTPTAYVLPICVEELVPHVYTDTGILRIPIPNEITPCSRVFLENR